MMNKLREALTEYANPLNWADDGQGARRLWIEPGTASPDGYNGFELARAALAEPAQQEPVAWKWTALKDGEVITQLGEHCPEMFRKTAVPLVVMAQPAAQQEPVATVFDTFGNTKDATKCIGHVWLKPNYFPPRGTLLYAQPAAQPPRVTDEMLMRFLGWPLPKTFAPDCGISFDGRKDDQWSKNKTWPIGTNLLTADQARAMLEHVLGIGKDAP